MIVFPAIDLKGGQVVRLAEGDMDRATVYGDNPAAQAMLFAEAGSQYLHVVDLDGSFAGRAETREAVVEAQKKHFVMELFSDRLQYLLPVERCIHECPHSNGGLWERPFCRSIGRP